MKRFFAIMIAGTLSLSMLTGCGNDTSTDVEPEQTEAIIEQAADNTDNQDIAGAPTDIVVEKITIGFVPSQAPDEIIAATEPLKELMTNELKEFGYEVGEVEIVVGTSYEAVGEGLSAGTIDVGLIPAGTYVLFDDGCDVILTATRNGLSVESPNAKDWNDNKPTEASDNQVTFYRALIIAGPSDAGKAVSEKVNNGEELTWEDLDSLNWSVMNTSSPAGYIYPSLWLQTNYDKHITDLTHSVVSESYDMAFEKLASGEVDVLVTYADARRGQVDKWTSEYGRPASVWDETNVIGVTDGIYNDTISVSKTSPIMDDALTEAVTQAFINIGNTDEGKEVFEPYSHNGYVRSKSEDYDSERAAQKLIMSLE